MKNENTQTTPDVYTLNNGIVVLGKKYKGKIHPMTFTNNLQAETQQVLTAATGVKCSIYIPPMSRIRYIRFD